jgi:NADH-quinone oxidoreductase subunit L
VLIVATHVGWATAILGAITALFGASVALAENDIKRVLAYSTVSQIGFMFIALGIGAGQAAMYHVVTHAFFKSLLFLGAGSVIHALDGEQNMDHMGGLRKQMPVTFFCMTVGALTLAGLPGLSAYFSKDLILHASFLSGHSAIAFCAMLTSLLTAVYSGRLIAMVFLGDGRSRHTISHALAASMRIPMLALVVPCVLVGILFVPFERSAWATALSSALLACAGLSLAWFFYSYRPSARTVIDEDFAPITNLLRNRWYVDAIFEEHFVEGVLLTASAGTSVADSAVVDGMVRGTAAVTGSTARLLGWADGSIFDAVVRAISSFTRGLSWPFRAIQTGFVQTYAFLLLVGAVAAIGYCLSR